MENSAYVYVILTITISLLTGILIAKDNIHVRCIAEYKGTKDEATVFCRKIVFKS
jgi:hypothetical protein